MDGLTGGLVSEDQLSARFWTVAEAADRWRGIREKLQGLTEAVDEDSGDTLESLCFIVDEVFNNEAVEDTLQEYAIALQEIADVLLVEAANPSVQALIVGELQKIVLPA